MYLLRLVLLQQFFVHPKLFFPWLGKSSQIRELLRDNAKYENWDSVPTYSKPTEHNWWPLDRRCPGCWACRISPSSQPSYTVAWAAQYKMERFKPTNIRRYGNFRWESNEDKVLIETQLHSTNGGVRPVLTGSILWGWDTWCEKGKEQKCKVILTSIMSSNAKS